MASAEAASVLAWFEFYARLCDDGVSATRPSYTLLRLLQSAFPSLYDEFIARRLMLGTEEWTCVIVLLEAFYEVELGVDRSALDDAMTLEAASQQASCARILEFVVSALVQSDSKARFVGDIMTMDESVQVDIMAVIERVLRHTSTLASLGEDVRDSSDGGLTYAETALKEKGHPAPLSTPSSSAHSHDLSTSSVSPGSQSPVHLARHAEIERLQRANDILKEDNILVSHELKELKLKLNHAEAQNTSLQQTIENIRLQAEMDILKKERTVRSYFDERIHSLQHELDLTTSALEEKKSVAKEVEELRDEIDLLRPAAEKLTKAEATLAKYKKKIEELTSAKETLRRIEEANANLVEKNLALETQAAKNAALQRKLSESKEANTTIQFHLSELETKLSRLTTELEAKRAECETSAAALLEATSLNKQLQETVDQQSDTKNGLPATSAGIAGGICELNPELMEKMARLQHDNAMLRSQVDGTTSDRIDSLLDEIDDLKRMRKSFETKYFDTLDILNETKITLRTTEEHVITTEGMLDACKQDLESMTRDHNRLAQSLEETEQRIRDLDNLVHELTAEIERRREHEAKLETAVEEGTKEITFLQLRLQETLQLLRLSVERSEALQEDATANESERTSLRASRDQLVQNVQRLKSQNDEQSRRFEELGIELENYSCSLEAARASITTLQQSEDRYAMLCEDLGINLKIKSDLIKDQNGQIQELRAQTMRLDVEISELRAGERHSVKTIQLLSEQLQCTQEDLDMIRRTREALMSEVKSLHEVNIIRQHQIQESQEANLALIEDFRTQLIVAEERKSVEMQHLESVQAQEREKLTTSHKRLIAAHEDQLQILAAQKAETIANMTELIDEKCNLLQRAMDDMANLRMQHERELADVHHQFDLTKTTLASEKESVARDFADYASKHNFKDEEVMRKEEAFQKELSELTTQFNEEKTKLHEQRDSLNAQITRLQNANREMKCRFDGQESKLRDAVKAQLEANRKLVDANHAAKSELTRKEARIVQLENAVTRLDSRIVVLERERNHFSSEEGKQRETDDSSSSYSSQLSVHLTQIIEELDSLRKDNKRLQDQLAHIQVIGGNEQDDATPQTSKSYLLDRIRHLERAKSLEEDKKRELLLMNAKLIQDQKQSQIRTAMDLKELNSLKEKVNAWMLRDERRKKEHEAFARRVQALDLENRDLRTKILGGSTDPSLCFDSQSSLESVELIQHVRSVNSDDQENIPPTENPPNSSIPSRKRKFDDNTAAEQLSETDIIVEKHSNDTHDIELPEAISPPPQSAPTLPRAKRRMSHFISNRQSTETSSDEKPSECQQQ